MTKRCAAIAAAILSFLLGGCWSPWGGGGAPVSPTGLPVGTAGPEVFEAGQSSYMAENYGRAAELMQQYAAANPGTEKGLAATYWAGMSRLALGDPVRARTELMRVKASRDASRGLQALTQRGIARCYRAEKDYTSAEAAYKRLMYLYPDASDNAETLRALAECADARGDTAAANGYRRELELKHPQSPYAAAPPASPTTAGKPMMVGAAGSVQYIVQAGVFSTRESASRLVRRLRSRNLEAIIIRQTTDRATQYIVQAGSFTTKSGAEQRAAELKRNGFDAIVKP